MKQYEVKGPDGVSHIIAGPDDATPEQIVAAASQLIPKAPAPEGPGSIASLGAGLGEGFGKVVLGAQSLVGKGVRAVGGMLPGSGGDTTLSTLITGQKSPGNIVQRAGDWLVNDAAAGRTKIAGENQPFADAHPGWNGTGQVGGELVGTLPAGGAIAKVIGAGAKAIPAAARFLDPIATAAGSGGLKTGIDTAATAGKVGDVAARMAGGALTGAASTALIDPNSIGAGAAIGAALPPVLKGAGALAGVAAPYAKAAVGTVASAVRGPVAQGAHELMTALDITPDQLGDVLDKLRNVPTLVQGSTPTVSQALQMPQASVLERVVAASPGGTRLFDAKGLQSTTRNDALAGVAPIDPNGFSEARNNLGHAISAHVVPAEKSAGQNVNDLFESVDPDNVSQLYLPIPGMQQSADRFLGEGTFGTGKRAADALGTARDVGTTELPAMTAAKAGPAPMSLGQAVRQSGGLSIVNNSGLAGELNGLRGDMKNIVRRNGGRSPADMAEKMHEAGYLPDDDPSTLMNVLREESAGRPHYSIHDDQSGGWAADSESAMGPPPGAALIPKTVPFRTVQNLRSSIGEAIDDAQAKGANKEAAALIGMKGEIDDSVNRLVAGDGHPDEYFPIDMANRWTDALQAHAAKMDRFHTGPQASIFRPTTPAQGGEIPQLFWGNRPGLSDDVDSFRKLIDDNPALLGQFRSMITTDAAGKMAQGDVLGQKFVDWTSNMLPGLRRAFDPHEVETIQNIAADVKRAAAGAKLGMGAGSPTYQNAANALDAGLVDTPAVKMAAKWLPFGEVVRSTLAEAAGKSKARRLADLLVDPSAAADALEGIQSGPARAAVQGGLSSLGSTLGGAISNAGPTLQQAPLSALRMELQPSQQ